MNVSTSYIIKKSLSLPNLDLLKGAALNQITNKCAQTYTSIRGKLPFVASLVKHILFHTLDPDPQVKQTYNAFACFGLIKNCVFFYFMVC